MRRFYEHPDAALEEGLDPARLSRFGRVIPKVPRSQVERLLQVNRAKVRNYTFMGKWSLHSSGRIELGRQRRRAWVPELVRRHFVATDILKVTDAMGDRDGVPFGPSDYTGLQPEVSGLVNSSGIPEIRVMTHPMDADYTAATAPSRFALCPGGHARWSTRAIAAIALGALPVIQSDEEDWAFHEPRNLAAHAMQTVMNLMHHVHTDQLPEVGYREDWAQRNWQFFVRYFTFMEGDNVPPGLTDCVGGGSVLPATTTSQTPSRA